MNVQSNLSLIVLTANAEVRESQLRRTSLQVNDQHQRRIVRRWIGRRLVRIGARLANEPAMRPARAR
ncbi:MAG: hypothetical protein ACT4OQ_01285 [Chloroflexota bacterium]